ncbi:MAG: hypothetical protein ACRCX2_33930 [Paraclostridium sp.]
MIKYIVIFVHHSDYIIEAEKDIKLLKSFDCKKEAYEYAKKEFEADVGEIIQKPIKDLTEKDFEEVYVRNDDFTDKDEYIFIFESIDYEFYRFSYKVESIVI